MSTQRSRFAGLFNEPQGNRTSQPVGKPVAKKDPGEETLEERKQEFKKRRKEEIPIARVKTNYEIRQDYVRALKRIAVDEERKIYEVIEDAITEYLERHKVSST